MTEAEKLWGIGDYYIHNDLPDAAIEDHLNNVYPGFVGETLKVDEYRKVFVSWDLDPEDVFSAVSDYVDDVYGEENYCCSECGCGEGPCKVGEYEEGNLVDFDDDILESAKKIIEYMKDRYKPYILEKTGNSITVDVEEWVKENRPDLLKRKKT